MCEINKVHTQYAFLFELSIVVPFKCVTLKQESFETELDVHFFFGDIPSPPW